MSLTTLLPAKPGVPHIKPAGRELELKFLVNDSGFKASQTWPALAAATPRRAVKLSSVYFDTAQGDLHRHRMSLRMRRQRRGYMMTLKYDGGFPGGMFERGEVEIFSAVDTPDVALFGPEFAALVAQAAQGAALAPAYATQIRRITHLLRAETSVIEVAFDAGFIVAGERKLPVREIELELKSGAPEDLYRLGMQLAKNFPVRLGTQAKATRGFHFSTGILPDTARSSDPLGGTPTVDEAIGAAINACLAQFTGNWPAFEQGDGVAAVHQMRVAMRRLRALLGLFARGFPCAEFLEFRDEAKQVAAAMGAARNFDVFLDLLRGGPCAAFPAEAGFAAILTECEAGRAAGHEAVRALLAAPETTRFILRLQAFVARHGWRNALAGEALPRLTAPARDFAAAHIARQHQRLLKRGKHLRSLSPHERHELRIGLKKLRYTADCFGGLFDAPKQVRAYMKAAANLQDALGGFNDLIVATDMVSQLEAADSRAAGIIIGWCGHGAAMNDTGLRAAWKAFRKVKLFAV